MPVNFDKIKSGLKKGFEKGFETAKEGIEIATEKSSQLIESQKIKSQISSLNNKVKHAYNDLGRKVYTLRDTEIGQMPELKGFLAEITRLYDEIELKKKDLEDIADSCSDDEVSYDEIIDISISDQEIIVSDDTGDDSNVEESQKLLK